MHPTYKRRNLLKSFSSVEDVDYMATTDPKEQQEKVRQHVERAMANVAKFDQNLAEMEREFEEQAIEGNSGYDEPEKNIKNLDVFWSDAEKDSMLQWENSLNKVTEWLIENKYEIENHFSVFDWLKLYADSILDYGMNNNMILKLEKIDRGEDFSGSHGRASQEWEELANAARYLADYREAVSAYKPEFLASMPEFLSRQGDLPNSASHASLWQKALQKKNEYIREQASKEKTDRAQVIREKLDDFNRVQQLGLKRDQIVERLEGLVVGQPAKVQNLVSELLNSPKTYVDFEQLADKLTEGEDPTTNLAGFIDTHRLISDVRSERGPAQIRSKLMTCAVDV